MVLSRFLPVLPEDEVGSGQIQFPSLANSEVFAVMELAVWVGELPAPAKQKF